MTWNERTNEKGYPWCGKIHTRFGVVMLLLLPCVVETMTFKWFRYTDWISEQHIQMATKNDMDMIRFDSIRFDSIEVIQYEQHGMAHSCATQQACNVSQSQLRDFNFVKEWTMCWSEMKQSTHTHSTSRNTNTHTFICYRKAHTHTTHTHTNKEII